MEDKEDLDLEEAIEQKEEDNSKLFDKKDDKDEKIFKLKPIKKHKGVGKEQSHEVVEVDKSKRELTKYNALKHGKYAELPIYCNDCYYRSKDEGGNGKCEAYKKDSVCTVRADIKKYCGELDSRDPDTLKTIVDNNIKMLNERVMFSIFTAGMDGNLLDKATNAQMNTLHSYIKLMKDLNGTVKITASTEETEGSGDADFITKMFKSISMEKS